MHAIRQLMPRLATPAAHAAIPRPSIAKLDELLSADKRARTEVAHVGDKEPEEIEKVRERESMRRGEPCSVSCKFTSPSTPNQYSNAAASSWGWLCAVELDGWRVPA